MKYLIAAVALLASIGTVRAAEPPTMTIDFVGDWCFDGLDAQNKNISWFKLPSWTEGGHCTKILSINKYGFSGEMAFIASAIEASPAYGGNRHCEPVKMRLTKDVAPSGTGYTATVIARCQSDGPVTAGKLLTFEFHRYKGSLQIITK
jgi:hypothetical protein